MSTTEQPTVFLSEWQALNTECEQLREALRACQRDVAPWIDRALEAERLLLAMAAMEPADNREGNCCGYCYADHMSNEPHGPDCAWEGARAHLVEQGLLKERE